MIDKVILDIAHSDDYTDYLFMTAALTNSRVIPLIDPSAEELRRQSDGNAFIFKCRNSRKALESGDVTVRADQYSHTILVLSRIYLDDDGEIDAGNAEIVRSLIQKAATDVLESAENLKEVYRLHFPTSGLKGSGSTEIRGFSTPAREYSTARSTRKSLWA